MHRRKAQAYGKELCIAPSFAFELDWLQLVWCGSGVCMSAHARTLFSFCSGCTIVKQDKGTPFEKGMGGTHNSQACASNCTHDHFHQLFWSNLETIHDWLLRA